MEAKVYCPELHKRECDLRDLQQFTCVYCLLVRKCKELGSADKEAKSGETLIVSYLFSYWFDLKLKYLLR